MQIISSYNCNKKVRIFIIRWARSFNLFTARHTVRLVWVGDTDWSRADIGSWSNVLSGELDLTFNLPILWSRSSPSISQGPSWIMQTTKCSSEQKLHSVEFAAFSHSGGFTPVRQFPDGESLIPSPQISSPPNNFHLLLNLFLLITLISIIIIIPYTR